MKQSMIFRKPGVGTFIIYARDGKVRKWTARVNGMTFHGDHPTEEMFAAQNEAEFLSAILDAKK